LKTFLFKFLVFGIILKLVSQDASSRTNTENIFLIFSIFNFSSFIWKWI